jgi:hypothetical protein
MWLDKLKDKSFQILFGMFIISLPMFFSTSIVDQLITPRIIENLRKEQYLRDNIKEGRHVVTDEISFSDNNIIKGDTIKNLNDGAFARSSDLDVISREVVELENFIQDELDKSMSSLVIANQEIKELNQVIKALASKEVEVTLFVSDLESDKGFVVLNLHNKAISQIIENDKKYYIYNDSGDRLALRSRVEPTPANNYHKNAAIGRLHRDDYHELFSGTRSGTRQAKIKID